MCREARVSKQVAEQMATDLLRDDGAAAATPDASGGGGGGGSTIVEMTPTEAKYKSVVKRLFTNCNQVIETAGGLKWKWICKLDQHVVSGTIISRASALLDGSTANQILTNHG
jgi:hypothetical protein